MCYEFEQQYDRRVEEARKAIEAEAKRKQARPAAPPKPAETVKPGEQAEPVPV